MKDPKTTVGGIVIVAALAMLWTHVLMMEQAITLMGVAGAWIGWKAKDGTP